MCFALGMGSGLYVDMRSLRRINKPFSSADLTEFQQVHKIVLAALCGMWATGLMLIYIRTGFVLSEFAPKLWMKLIVVSALTTNAFVIGMYVLPNVKKAIGQSAIEMPLRVMVPMTFAAASSMFCWLGGVVLGASVSLKTADWATLSKFFAAEFVVIVFGSVVGIIILRAILRRKHGLSGPNWGKAAEGRSASRDAAPHPAE